MSMDWGEWKIPPHPPRTYIEDYGERIKAIPGVIGMTAEVHGCEIRFHTVIEDGRETESAVYDAELAFFDQWGDDVCVDFHVKRRV